MSGAAAEGKAGICSLFVAWPSCFTGQYGREAHLTQNNILTDGKPNVISAVALAQTPGIYQLALLLSIWVFLWAIFRSVSVTEAGGKKWAKRPNLDVVDPKREARFIPVVSKYWPVPSQLTPLKPGFLCCTAKLSVLSVCSTPTLLLLTTENKAQQTDINPQTCCLLMNYDQMSWFICPFF